MTETPENIPQANELLYTMKLINGEELLFTLIDMTDSGVQIESPVKIAIIPMLDEDGSFINRLHTSSWSPFSSARIFYIEYKDIVTMTPMHEKSHKLYTKLVNQLEGYEDLEDLPSTDSFYVDCSRSIQ